MSKIRKFIDNKFNNTLYEKARFVINGVTDDEFEGYTNGELWNGWEKPYFEKRISDKILEVCKKYVDDRSYYDNKKDEYIIYSNNDEPEIFVSEIIETSDGRKKVYGIGAGSWTWDLAESTPFYEIKEWDFDEIKKYKDSKSKLRKSKKFKDDNYKQFAFGTIEKNEIDYFYEKNDFDDKDLRFYFEIDRYNTFEEAMDALKEYKKELFDAKSFGSIVGLYISREEKIIYMENFESFEIYKPVEIYPENKFRKDSKIKNNLSQNKKFNDSNIKFYNSQSSIVNVWKNRKSK